MVYRVAAELKIFRTSNNINFLRLLKLLYITGVNLSMNIKAVNASNYPPVSSFVTDCKPISTLNVCIMVHIREVILCTHPM